MIKEKIKESKIINWIYSQEQDFNNGRSFFGKFTSLSGEVNTILILFLGWDTFKDKLSELSVIIIGILFLVYLFGKFYRRANLLEVDQRATANRSPLSRIQLRACEIIISRFGGDVEFEKDIRKSFEKERE